jgi:Tfp pilus assembly protein PilF
MGTAKFNSTSIPVMSRRRQTRAAANTIGLVLLIVSAIGCNATTQRQNVAGRAAFDQGRHAQAINSFQQVLNRDPKNSDAYYNLAACYYEMGKAKQNKQFVDQAEQLYRQAITHNGQHVDAHRGLVALLIETKREKFAFDVLDGWRQRMPQSPAPLIELARVYQEYGDDTRATDLLADALKIDSQSTRALKALGHIREVQGQNQLALDNYTRALQIDNLDQTAAAKVASLQNLIRTGNSGSGTAPQRYGNAAPYLLK